MMTWPVRTPLCSRSAAEAAAMCMTVLDITLCYIIKMVLGSTVQPYGNVSPTHLRVLMIQIIKIRLLHQRIEMKRKKKEQKAARQRRGAARHKSVSESDTHALNQCWTRTSSVWRT